MKKQTAKELKYQARVLLNGSFSKTALLTFLMGLLDFVLNTALSYALPYDSGGFGLLLYLVCSVLCNMVYYIFLAGLMRTYLRLCRGGAVQTSDLISVFTDRPEQVAVYSVVQFLLQTAASYAANWCVSSMWRARALQPVPLAVLLAVGILFVWLELCLALVLFLYCDAPWKSALQLIRESWRMMRGNRCRMLYLTLSFLGVAVLGVLSLGIGFLFIRPYLYVSQALFYLNLTPPSDRETADGQ